jgi:hypothetical protein
VLCVACAWRCVRGDNCVVCSGCGCAGRPAGGLCVCMLRASVRCGVRGLFACAVLGDTRHEADVPLWWLTFVASCVSVCARVCGVMVSGSVALVGMCVGCALRLRKCEESWLRHTRDVRCASWACIAGAVSSAVSRVLWRSIAIADVAAPRFAVAAM